MTLALESSAVTQPAVDRLSAGTAAGLRALALGYVVYVPLAVTLTLLARYQLNVDGVAYLRIARYYAAGRFDLAVTGYWAPLLSWLLVPWARGGDPVLAAHVVSAAAGGLFVLAAWRLARLVNPAGRLLWCTPLVAGLLALNWLGRGVFADPLLAALLTLYFVASLRMCRSLRSLDAALAGVTAAVCYHAKYYCLPFFLLHHTLAVFALGGTGVRPGLLPRVRCWLVGGAVFAVLVAPWVVELSVHYGRPTFATTGQVVHSLAGPVVPDGDYWPNCRLMVPRDGRIATWENPDEFTAPWPTWSTWSASGLVHRARLLYRNLREVGHWVFDMDALGLLYITLLALPLLAWLSPRNTPGADPRVWHWLLGSIVAYLSGLMLVFAGTRRYYWPLEGLLLAAALQGADHLLRAWTGVVGGRLRARLLAAGVAAAFIGSAALPLLDVFRAARGQPGLDLQQVSERLAGLGVTGPFASNNWHQLLPVGWRMDQVCVGVPRPGDADVVRADLRAAGARWFLEFVGAPLPLGAAALDGVVEQIAGPPAHVIDAGALTVRVYDLDPGSAPPSGP